MSETSASAPAAPARRLLLVHAHPDDETLGTGATMAKYAAEGAQVTLVTCTLGEEGEVIPAELAYLASDRDDDLGPYRIGELTRACAALGVTDHRFLGGAGRWRDSGMVGTPAGDHPAAFARADPDQAVHALVEVLRAVRPQVVVTYDARGGYGHPDHVQAHRVTMASVARAGDPSYEPAAGRPWEVQKVYWTAVARSGLEEGLARLRAEGPAEFRVVAHVGELGFGNDDGEITTEVDGSRYLGAKLAAMRAHATQIVVREPFYALSDLVGHLATGTEQFVLAHGRPLTERETDLFDGLDLRLDTPNG